MMVNNDSIEIIEENISTSRTSIICQHINSVCDRIWGVSFRKCKISDSDYERLIRTLKNCKLLKYINFNINFINSIERLSYLSTLLSSLTYLDTLCLHSSNLTDEGLKILYYSLLNLKHFRSLDIGDCKLTDNSVSYIRDLVHRKEHSNGLYELVLSSNPKITSIGWSKILVSVASCSDLKYFHIDYNNLDDSCGYLLVAILCSNHALEILDLEHTGLGNKTAILLLYLLKNYKLNIKNLNLLNNPIDKDLQNEIKQYVKNDYDSTNLNNAPNHQQQKLTNTSQSVNEEKLLNTTPRIKFDLDETSHQNKKSSKYQNFGLKIRDQLKLDKFVEKANRFNLTKSYNKIDYQRDLERELNKPEHKNNNNKQYKVLEQQPEDDIQNDNDDDKEYEFLKTYEDLRFKSHSVLPFNMKKY